MRCKSEPAFTSKFRQRVGSDYPVCRKVVNLVCGPNEKRKKYQQWRGATYLELLNATVLRRYRYMAGLIVFTGRLNEILCAMRQII